MSLPVFKVGDEVLYQRLQLTTTITRISNDSHGNQLLWGYWKNLKTGETHRFEQFTHAEKCELFHPQLKYDPMQQGDKDEDI